MTNVKKLLLAATALTLVSGAALAADNKSYSKQAGDSNSMSVTQSGNANVAGRVREPAGQLDQNGTANKLVIIQSGNEGEIGTYGANGENVDGAGAGVDQYGAYNTANVDQSGFKNYIGNILQNNRGVQTSSALNETTIDQAGSENKLNYVIQRYDNSADGRTGANAKNTVSVTYSSTADKNGSTGLTAGGRAAGVSASVGGLDNGVSQTGADNKVGLTIRGDSNAFAVKQVGRDNRAQQLTINGSENQLGINQLGLSNRAVVGVIASGSDKNDIGIKQNGVSNYSYVGVSGDSNGITTDQNGTNYSLVSVFGNSNLVTSYQEGDNSALVGILGSDNLLNISQTGSAGLGSSGSGNSVNVGITGSGNNRINSNARYSDTPVALKAAQDNNLLAGDLFQRGSGNTMNLVVLSSENDFAMLQKGDGNTINGSIRGGTGNAAVVAQMSNGNVANFVQNGSNNDLAVVQGGSQTYTK